MTTPLPPIVDEMALKAGYEKYKGKQNPASCHGYSEYVKSVKCYESARQQPTVDALDRVKNKLIPITQNNAWHAFYRQGIAEALAVMEKEFAYAGEASGATIAPQTVETALPSAPAPTVADIDVLKQAKEALEYVGKACLCTRNTPGFEYSQNHKRLGKAGAGQRWVEPREKVLLTISRLNALIQQKEGR